MKLIALGAGHRLVAGGSSERAATMNQTIQVPAGFVGWWCTHCDAPAPGIPADLDAAQAKCPRCRKWTAVWVPGEVRRAEQNGERPGATPGRAGGTPALPSARPRLSHKQKALWFAHMHAVVDGEADSEAEFVPGEAE